MLTVSRIQTPTSSLFFDYYPSNLTGNVSDDTASNSCCDGLDNVEILIDDSEWLGTEIVKKIKIDNLQSIQKPVFQKEAAKQVSPFNMAIPLTSFNNVTETKPSKPEEKKLTASQRFKKALGELNAPTSLLGKRKNLSSIPSQETSLEAKTEEKKMELEDSAKPVLVGPKYQAELPTLNRQGRSRNLKPVWNPESMSEGALESCLNNMHKAISQNISNQEKAVKLLVAHNLNVDGLLAEMKKNKLYYRGVFSLNQRTRRDKTLQKENYASMGAY